MVVRAGPDFGDERLGGARLGQFLATGHIKDVAGFRNKMDQAQAVALLCPDMDGLDNSFGKDEPAISPT